MAERDAVLARIRLRHLQAFLAVVQCGKLRRAADALSISQPAVTKTLNELEDVLGVKLFERGRRLERRRGPVASAIAVPKQATSATPRARRGEPLRSRVTLR